MHRVKQSHSSPCIGIFVEAQHLTQYGCEVLFICAKVFQNLYNNKLIDLTLSFCSNPFEVCG